MKSSSRAGAQVASAAGASEAGNAGHFMAEEAPETLINFHRLLNT